MKSVTVTQLKAEFSQFLGRVRLGETFEIVSDDFGTPIALFEPAGDSDSTQRIAMKREKPEFETIPEYIETFPPDVQKILKKIRSTIRKAAPRAVESISYQIPTYKLDGKPLIYFAAYANHVSVYPAPRSALEFAEELAAYKGGKGTVQFPLDKPIPYELITRIVTFRASEL